ncbi:MAG: HAD-IIB family hydrolase [Planctomycetes bacterium]|nr:HAD-IIB family hydrolase [Planctomycetota bacterium]
MRYLALACDYDGTLALNGLVDEPTLAALERLLASGRKLILVTGRELPDLQTIFPHLNLFERVVAENGALLYRPGSREEKRLAERPPDAFIASLKKRGVQPLSVGQVIVATWHPHEAEVLEAIHEFGLELQVIFNKDAVMVLPANVNKASGLSAALKEIGLSPHNIAGVGDAENDHAFLARCECGVAVDNALPMLKEKADLVTRRDHGAGVAELIDRLIQNDLVDLGPRLKRHHVLAGTTAGGETVLIDPIGISLLIAGTSGSGKSTLATGLMERLAEQRYQFCVIDPEGDYETFEIATPIGSTQRAPTIDEVLQLMKTPTTNAVVSLVGLPIGDRPSFLLTLLPRLQEMRARTGRPHWLVLDEAHHLLPSSWEPGALALPPALEGVVMITVHPGMIARPALASVNTLAVIGSAPSAMFDEFSQAVGGLAPPVQAGPLEPGQALLWRRGSGEAPLRMRVAPCKAERRRHTRKYAEGELPPERSFYFTGPEGKLHLRAQNLFLFAQMAEGIDDVTWLHHLTNGDYSRWFRERIKDEELAADAEGVERMNNRDAAESRKLIRQVIERYYTLPASSPLPIPGTDAASRRNP